MERAFVNMERAPVNMERALANMERALVNRLAFGSLMLLTLVGVFVLDHLAESWTRSDRFPAGIKGIGLALFLLMILPAAVVELARLFSAKHAKPYRFIAASATSCLIAHAFLTQFPWFHPIAASSLAFIIVLTMVFAALRLGMVRQIDDAIPVLAGTVLATLYIGGQAWFLMALRVKTGETLGGSAFMGSTMTVVMILLTVKFTDIAAYFGGRALGRHKLIPWLSPGKTWEGLACGILVAGAVGAACAPLLTNLTAPKGLAFGILMGAVGQLGDLLESLLKRDAQVKDSSALIPGFGGILDVIDSPLLAAPFAYLLFSLW
jgi:phosphatidate cytidylyltransferase